MHSSDNPLINPNRFTDSAGVSWAGREFDQNPFSNDDGSTPAALAAALDEFASSQNQALVIQALAESRLLVPLMANLGESETGAHGHTVDKSAELALITVQGPDQAPILPVFSSVEHMRAWNPEARPVPIDARRIALAAAADGTNRMVLNPKSNQTFVVRRPAIAAIAQGFSWVQPHLDEVLIEALGAVKPMFSVIKDIRFISGDPTAQLAGPELLIQLQLEPGLTRDEVSVITQALSIKWSEIDGLNEKIDSVQIQVVS